MEQGLNQSYAAVASANGRVSCGTCHDPQPSRAGSAACASHALVSACHNPA